MEKKKPTYYITTPIYYPSGKWHLGHSYTTVCCDAMARFKRMSGFDVFYLTGTDEHGQKIEKRANEAGVEPKIFVDKLVDSIKELWSLLDISYDKFIRTTDEYHVEAVQKIFKKLYDNGDIYKAEYKGKYCTPCEAFWTETQAKDGKCPDCGRDVTDSKEECYFFRLSKYESRIKELLKSGNFLEPSSRVNEMLNNFVNVGLDDIAISRTSFKWGIPVPFDSKHIVYVWIDALSNYITALGYLGEDDSLFQKYWPADLHVMAKEIVRFHSIIWPALLMALDLPLPKKVFGHGWLLFGGDKMSKSKGNVVDPFVLCDRYGVDAIRYYLLREIPFGSDSCFTNEGLISRINSDLANDLGNLVKRTFAMANQYLGGKVEYKGEVSEFDDDFISKINNLYSLVEQSLDGMLVNKALEQIFDVIGYANKYIDLTRPWTLNKEGKKTEVEGVIYNLVEAIRVCATMLTPFITKTPNKIFSALNINAPTDFSLAKFVSTNKFVVTEIEPLFPRLDKKKELEFVENCEANAGLKASGELLTPNTAKVAEKGNNDEIKANCANAGDKAANLNKIEQKEVVVDEEVKTEITIDEFFKTELKVAKVIACEKVEKADKLLKLTLQVGKETRTVVSGIAKSYSAEEMIGKEVVLVANLKPAKLRGIESQGMILCATNGDKVVLVSPEKIVESGAEVC